MAFDPLSIVRAGLGAGQLIHGLSTLDDRKEDQRGQERIRRLLAQAQARNLRQGQAIAGSGAGISPALAQRAALQSVSEANQAATEAAMDQESALALADRERADELAGSELGALGAFGAQMLTALQRNTEDDEEETTATPAPSAVSQALGGSGAAPVASGSAPAAGGAASTPMLRAASTSTPASPGGPVVDSNLLQQFLAGELSAEQMSALEQQYSALENEDMSIKDLGFRDAPVRTDSTNVFGPTARRADGGFAIDRVGAVEGDQRYAPDTAIDSRFLTEETPYANESDRLAARLLDAQDRGEIDAFIDDGRNLSALDRLDEQLFGEPLDPQVTARVGDPTAGVSGRSADDLTSQLGSQVRATSPGANLELVIPGPPPPLGDHGPGVLNDSNILPEAEDGGIFGASGAAGIPQAFLDGAPAAPAPVVAEEPAEATPVNRSRRRVSRDPAPAPDPAQPEELPAEAPAASVVDMNPPGFLSFGSGIPPAAVPVAQAPVAQAPPRAESTADSRIFRNEDPSRRVSNMPPGSIYERAAAAGDRGSAALSRAPAALGRGIGAAHSRTMNAMLSGPSSATPGALGSSLQEAADSFRSHSGLREAEADRAQEAQARQIVADISQNYMVQPPVSLEQIRSNPRLRVFLQVPANLVALRRGDRRVYESLVQAFGDEDNPREAAQAVFTRFRAQGVVR